MVGGQRPRAIAPPSALRAATSPWLRHREDWNDSSPPQSRLNHTPGAASPRATRRSGTSRHSSATGRRRRRRRSQTPSRAERPPPTRPTNGREKGGRHGGEYVENLG